MIEEILYDSLFFTFETNKEETTDSITSYSYDGENYDFDDSNTSGETSFIFIN